MAKKLDGDDKTVFVLTGDGELQEGQIWEGLMFAAHNKVDNLVAVVDWNGQQIDGSNDDVLSLGDMVGKWTSFGWEVLQMDGHNYEELIATLNKAKVNTGLTLGEDGATHQILEDLGMMKMLPGMTVINPCDYNQVISATHAIAEINGPVYLRFGRPSWPVFMPEDNFEIGKAIMMQPGTDVTIIATGHMVYHAMEAVKILKSDHSINAELINIHTIKPLDDQAILSSVTKTGAVVTAEEHQRNGGLGDSVAQVLSQYLPSPQEYVAVNDSFGESGTPAQLLDKYGLGIKDVVSAAVKAVERKK
ncbi:UNVERIFIED_CONTAM: hypothetical protein GTU68_033782 [Idotea baltica]|nr:hypothetical protein [Idotea baltica]